MTRNEYEERKQRLEEQLRTGMQLLQAAHEAQLRALEMVWMSTSGEARPAAPRAAAPAPAEPPRPPRRNIGQVYSDLKAALPRLPQVFDRNDVCRELGYEPDRIALYRLLKELVQGGQLQIHVPGEGRKATKYRRT